ncbi:MAG TPA: class I SAM-dependent methyltransferase [Fimbriimonadaceae bacterium]|nr:class I SAM-dependent methyltransferase [Fimbriimonadaceae bacterium]
MPKPLRDVFDSVADLYDRARPSYPGPIFDDLLTLAPPHPHVLEIGCGTGKASVALAQRGCRLTGIELGKSLAAIARRNLATFKTAKVLEAEFESWNPGPDRFDIIFAISAWHWIDPATGYRKTAEILKQDGLLAIVANEHAFPKDFDPFFSEIQPTYDAIGEAFDAWPPPTPDETPDLRGPISESGFFDFIESRRYLWTVDYDAEGYIDLLNTYSGHLVMEASKKETLYRAIREIARDRTIRKHYLSVLNVARRKPSCSFA